MPSAMPCSDIASLFSAHHSALKVDYFCLLSLLPMLLKNTQRAGKTLSPRHAHSLCGALLPFYIRQFAPYRD